MTITGVVVNGKVEFDVPGSMPEGSRVELDYAEDDMPVPPPFEPLDRATWLAELKEAHRQSVKDPEGGMSLEECMATVAAELDLPYPPQE